ncbi:MAG: peptidase M28, partial [Hassallia sp.]
ALPNAFQNSSRENLLPVLILPIPIKGLLTLDTLRSNHAPFWYQGVGAVLITDTANLRTPYYHQASDTPKTIERSFFTGSAQIVVNATTVLLGDRTF